MDEVPDNVFRLPSRISSTWGGNLTDMVRSTHYLRIIEQERLVENAAEMGRKLLDELRRLALEQPLLSGARGRGLMIAFDLPNRESRDEFYRGLFDLGLLAIRCGERSIRFRPVLDITADIIGIALDLLRQQCRRMEGTVHST
jgi:L-lysine 6-transaminase